MGALVRRGAWRGGLTYVLTTGVTMQTIDTLVTELAQAEQRIAALESALRALVGESPFCTDMDSNNVCHFCSATKFWDNPDHDDACPWLAAQALVGD